jgi:hypothetical protein
MRHLKSVIIFLTVGVFFACSNDDDEVGGYLNTTDFVTNVDENSS